MLGGPWTVGLLGVLRLATETPDALCPTLADVRSAVQARVGEVAGGEYEARFRLVRGARGEGDALHLELHDESGAAVLVRELPVDRGACEESAQAVALILERYFEQLGAVESTSSSEPAQSSGPVEGAPVEGAPVEGRAAAEGNAASGLAASNDAPPPGAAAAAPVAPTPAAEATSEQPSPWALRAAGGGGWLGGEGTGFVGLGGEVWLGSSWSLAVDGQWTSLERTDTSSAPVASAKSLWLFATAQVWARAGRWSLGIGPSLAGQVETAHATGVQEGERSAARFVWGAGGLASLRFALSAHWSVETSARLVALAAGATKQFVFDAPDGTMTEVLPPASSLFLWGGGLQFRF
ncbi:MAG TPA: hypothetical protein VLC09_08985 [Polyangiaceae bacterium]|nr:hypothetical protein [Polyangiaceae bacterium]